MIKVTNRNDFDFIGRHNGVDYGFPKSEPVYVENDAATHIFGLGVPDKTTVLARHGWAGVDKTYDMGMAILNRFTFEHEAPRYDAPLARQIIEEADQAASEADHGPAPVIQSATAGETGTDGPVNPAVAVAEHRRGKGRP